MIVLLHDLLGCNIATHTLSNTYNEITTVLQLTRTENGQRNIIKKKPERDPIQLDQQNKSEWLVPNGF